MTRLAEALDALNLRAELELSGRWARISGERCAVFVVEAPGDNQFYTWCALPDLRAVERYDDPIVAIRQGLWRARRSDHPDSGVAAPGTNQEE